MKSVRKDSKTNRGCALSVKKHSIKKEMLQSVCVCVCIRAFVCVCDQEALSLAFSIKERDKVKIKLTLKGEFWNYVNVAPS